MKDGDLFLDPSVEVELLRFAALDPQNPDGSIGGLPASRRMYRRFGKRVLDLFLVLATAPVTLLVVGVLALLVMLDGANPFFGHERVGRNGKVFRCWKLRSMVPDAEKRLAAHLAADPLARREWETEFKLTRDPRITRLGNFLRKSSLDELPQLWNVFRGQMSLVGARPVTRAELPRYGALLPAYYAQRPGVTGKWQVGGRNSISYAKRVAMDASYLRDCSLSTDLKLIAATIWVVFRRTGR